MKPLVSVIIPNFNEVKFIGKCIDSVLNQTYENIEILIVDDGSKDESLSIIKKYADENENVSFWTQKRQNAAVARNKGMENAKGDYYFFLDSDDYVYPDSIEKMVRAYEENDADFVIGNMHEMDEEDNVTKDLKFFDQTQVIDDYKKLIALVPAPSNKFFKAKLVKDNNVTFGNVRIGQDLNFFLKYILNCKKIVTMEDYIYNWRDVSTSMSRSVNFKIFDITESFKDIKNYYEEHNGSQDYQNYIRMIEYHNYYRQMEKQRNFPTAALRKLVINYFDYNIKALGDVRQCSNFSEFEDAYKKCSLKLSLKALYASGLFKKFYERKNLGK